MMKKFIYNTKSPEATTKLAVKLATLVNPGDVITLEGDLGAGKTTFTKGFAKGLGISRNVNSPTFTIIKEYTDGRIPLYHMDVYRLEDSEEDLGFEEYFNSDGVTMIEWASMIKDQLPPERLEIEIFRSGDDEREINFTAIGSYYLEKCKELDDESISD